MLFTGGNTRRSGWQDKKLNKKRSMFMENDAKMREKYLAPEVEVMEVALEKGFAITDVAVTDEFQTGSLAQEWHDNSVWQE